MSSKKDITTLVEDIYSIFTDSHTIDEKNLEDFGERMKAVLRKSITAAGEKRTPTLRMSVIGKPDRQLWYELNTKDPRVAAEFDEEDVYEPNPEKYLKFLFGDIIEQLLVFLIKESGHTISHEQEELSIDGVLGHTDGAIDGVPSDIKSASNFSFIHKFKQGRLLRPEPENDPFGYKGQLAGYQDRLVELYPDEMDPDRVCWLAMNKETGELHLLIGDVMDLPNPVQRVEDIKDFLSKSEPPKKKCYDPVPDGKSGNLKLHNNCVYCPFKFECWKAANGGDGLRAFKYSDSVRYLTHVESAPRVDEITISN